MVVLRTAAEKYIQPLKVKSNAFHPQLVHDEIVKLLRHLESMFLGQDNFLDQTLQFQRSTEEVPPAAFSADELKEANPSMLRLENGVDVQVPEENLDWISRIEIAAWLRD